MQIQGEQGEQPIIKKYLPLKEILYKTTWTDNKNKKVYQIIEYDPLIDYLQDKQEELKLKLFYVSDLSPEGHQF